VDGGGAGGRVGRGRVTLDIHMQISKKLEVCWVTNGIKLC